MSGIRDEILEGLNDEQVKAVRFTGGPLLVVAAAGSGKTTVLTRRAAYRIVEGADPRGLTLCTFTKKAAEEMAERAVRLIPAADSLSIGTIHSLMFKILRAEGWPWRHFEVVTGFKQRKLLKEAAGRYPIRDIGDALRAIGLWKNELIEPEEVWDEEFGPLYGAYEQARRDGRLIDFDDMLVEAVKLFRLNEGALSRARAKHPEIMLDEAHDTSTAQWAIMQALAAPANDIAMVADLRQSIYRFRGARPDHLLTLEDRFPGLTTIQLPRNYRSTPEVIGAANRLISHAEEDFEPMVAERGSVGSDPRWTEYPSPDEEAAAIADEIIAIRDEGTTDLGQVAVLYRINAYSRALEESLAAREIPYVVLGGRGFFGRSEVMDACAYIRLATAPDEESLRRVINKPTRYLGAAFCDAVVERARSGIGIRVALALTERTALKALHQGQLRSVRELDRHLMALQQLRPGMAVGYILRTLGYEDWLHRDEEDAEDRVEALRELAQIAERFDDAASFLAYVAEQQDATGKDEDQHAGRVQLMTVHRAKGLEWDVVFVAGASLGLMPHAKAHGDQLAEERRIAYVAVTRARDRLRLTSVQAFRGKAAGASPFVSEAGLMEVALTGVVDTHDS